MFLRDTFGAASVHYFSHFLQETEKERERKTHFPNCFNMKAPLLITPIYFTLGIGASSSPYPLFIFLPVWNFLFYIVFPWVYHDKNVGCCIYPDIRLFRTNPQKELNCLFTLLQEKQRERQRSTNCPSFWMGMHIHNLLLYYVVMCMYYVGKPVCASLYSSCIPCIHLQLHVISS